jgi:hypothetical protein
VEFPFGHTLGPAGDAALPTRVIRAALDVLVTARPPGPVTFRRGVARRLRRVEKGLAPEATLARNQVDA